MSATSKRQGASSELRDWRVWAIVAGTALALGHALLERLGWWALLLLLPLIAAVATGAWLHPRKRPTGFAAEATRALAAHLPDGGRAPRVVCAEQQEEAWEVEWRLHHRSHGPALLKKVRDLEHELGAALQLRLDKDRLRLRAGTAAIPDLVTYEDFYRHAEPAGELVVGIGECSRPRSRSPPRRRSPSSSRRRYHRRPPPCQRRHPPRPCTRPTSIRSPVSAASQREVERQRTHALSDQATRERHGFMTSRRREHEIEQVLTREDELASGHEELRFTSYLAVSAPRVYELELACKEVQRQASRARLQLVRLAGEQAAAFTCAALLLGRGCDDAAPSRPLRHHGAHGRRPPVPGRARAVQPRRVHRARRAFWWCVHGRRLGVVRGRRGHQPGRVRARRVRDRDECALEGALPAPARLRSPVLVPRSQGRVRPALRRRRRGARLPQAGRQRPPQPARPARRWRTAGRRGARCAAQGAGRGDGGRHGRRLTSEEQSACAEALREVSGRFEEPTLPPIVAEMLEPTAATADALHTARRGLAQRTREAALGLRRMVEGDLVGMFYGPTSDDLDLTAPVVSLNLSSVYESDALGILMTCAASWLKRAVELEDGVKRILVVGGAGPPGGGAGWRRAGSSPVRLRSSTSPSSICCPTWRQPAAATRSRYCWREGCSPTRGPRSSSGRRRPNCRSFASSAG